MKITMIVGAGALLLACSACSPTYQPLAATPGPNAPVMSSARGASAQMPQSANSLPAGDTVNAPISQPQGNLTNTPTTRRY